LTNKYEQSIPSLKVDALSLSREGSFIIKNIGGGLLTGSIISRVQDLNINPITWSGNNQVINYAYTSDHPANGYIYITSNGGEMAIPVNFESNAMTIQTDEGHKIADIQDFYNYAKDYPAGARRLFTSSDFYMLLLSNGYKYMEIYENLHKDVNRERALDNFFILSGLKTKPDPIIEAETPIERLAPPFSIRLPRVGFRYEDRGIIEIENNTGLDITVEAYSRERYVRFFTNMHIIAAHYDGPYSIPFEIRPSAFSSAQRLFRRLPYIPTFVDVRAYSTGFMNQKRLYLSIGEW